MIRPSASLGGVPVGGEAPVVLMGVLNVSPESFYTGSIHLVADALCRAAEGMVKAGASLIDVGAMSTAPWVTPRVTEEEERQRLATAVGVLAARLRVPISADTARAGPAGAAIDAGATVVNDVTGLGDERLGRLAAERRVSMVLMASPAAARAGHVAIDAADPVGTVRACLATSLSRALAAGIPADRIVLDPGVGFFLEAPDARADWDARVVAGLGMLAGLGRPLAVGVSRKSFIGAITGRRAPEDRLAGSLAATALVVLGGAALVRTHDVGETRDAVRVAERVAQAGTTVTVRCPDRGAAFYNQGP